MKTTILALLLIITISVTAGIQPKPIRGVHKGPRALTEYLDSSKVWLWDSSSHTWDKLAQGEFCTYDGNNDLLTDAHLLWQSGAWHNDYQETYSYDANYNRTHLLSQVWQSGAWVTDNEGLYTYDTYNNMTSAVIRGAGPAYDTTELATWTYNGSEILTQHQYAYSSSGTGLTNNEIWACYGDQYHPSSIIEQVLVNGNQWVNKTKRIYNWVGGQDDTIRVQKWAGGAWVDSSLHVSTPALIQDFAWTNGSYWQYTNQQVFVLDAHGHPTSTTDQTWTGGAWQTSYQTRSGYTYDGSGRILTQNDSVMSGGIWVLQTIDSFAYDAAGNQTLNGHYNENSGSNLPNFQFYRYTFDGYNMMTSQVLYQTSYGQVYSNDSTHYYYHTGAINAGINDVALDGSISVYPVPAHGMLTIVDQNAIALTATLHDMTGRELLSQRVEGTLSQVNISALPAGVYQLSLTDGRGGKAMRRIVVE